MNQAFLNFAVGSLILLASTHFLIKLANKVSGALKISPLVVGITIVSFCTILPELSLTVAALVNNDQNLAMGNLIGSIIINILLVLPIGILVGRMRIGTTKTQRSGLFLLLATIIFVWIQFSSFPDKATGLILFLTGIFIMLIEFMLGFAGRSKEDKKMFDHKRKEKFSAINLVGIVLAIGGIIYGSSLAVDSVETISIITGLSTTVLGLTLTAVVTSFPELMTVFFSQEEGEEKIAVGNVVGSNLYDLLIIGGIIIFFSGKSHISIYNLATLSFVVLLFILLLRKFKGKTIPKLVGLGLLTLMGVFIWSLKF